MSEEKKYYLTDLETGIQYQCSKESWEAHQNMVRHLQECFKTLPNSGKPIIIGTPNVKNDFNWNSLK